MSTVSEVDIDIVKHEIPEDESHNNEILLLVGDQNNIPISLTNSIILENVKFESETGEELTPVKLGSTFGLKQLDNYKIEVKEENYEDCFTSIPLEKEKIVDVTDTILGNVCNEIHLPIKNEITNIQVENDNQAYEDICMGNYQSKNSNIEDDLEMELEVKTDIDLKNTDDSDSSYWFDGSQDIAQKCYKCLVCGYKTINKNYIEQAANGVSYLCLFCSYQTKNQAIKINHETTKTEDSNAYKHSTSCDFSTTGKVTMVEHIKEKQYPTLRTYFDCLKCKSKYKSLTLLHNHLKTMHLDSSEIFACSYCEFETDMSKEYINHLRYSHVNVSYKTIKAGAKSSS